MNAVLFMGLWLAAIGLANGAKLFAEGADELETNLECPVDLVFLVDVSGSICKDEDVSTCTTYEEMKGFLKDIISGIKVGRNEANIAIITFGSQADLEFNFDRYTDSASIVSYIDEKMKYVPMQTTRTDLALQTMMNRVVPGRDNVPVVAVVVTDGLPTDSSATIYQARQAHNAGVMIYAIGVGEFTVTNPESEMILLQISSDPKEKFRNYFMSEKFVNALDFVDDIQFGACSLDCKVDLVVFYDRSGSICNDENVDRCDTWNSMSVFLKDLVTELQIGPMATQVALIIFDSDSYLSWNFDRYSAKSDVLYAIDGLRYMYEPHHTTNLDKAFKLMASEVRGSRGDRLEAPNVILLLSDGKPTIESATLREAEDAKTRGEKIYAVGVGNSHRENLKGLSSSPNTQGRNYFLYMEDVHEPSLAASIQVDGCRGASIGNLFQDPTECIEQVDVVFLLDISRHLCGGSRDVCDNWRHMKSFVREVVGGMAIGKEDTRVAVRLFGTFVYYSWELDSFLDQSGLMSAVSDLMPSLGEYQLPYYSTAMEEMIEAFRSQSRQAARKLAILVTHTTPGNESPPYQGENILRTAREAEEMGITVLPVGVRTSYLSTALMSLTISKPDRVDMVEGDDYYLARPGFSALGDLVKPVLEKYNLLRCSRDPNVLG